MAHTQGRWWSERDEHDTRHVIRAENVEHPIANVNSYWRGDNCPDRTQREANARLMAAAPELLEALRQAMGWIDSWHPNFTDDPDWPEVAHHIKVAIAKASQP